MERHVRINWSWRRWCLGFNFVISENKPRAIIFSGGIGPLLIVFLTHPDRFSYKTL